MVYTDDQIKDAKGFNRNIVECKSICIVIHAEQFLRFNRNIVECKLFPFVTSLMMRSAVGEIC